MAPSCLTKERDSRQSCGFALAVSMGCTSWYYCALSLLSSAMEQLASLSRGLVRLELGPEGWLGQEQERGVAVTEREVAATQDRRQRFQCARVVLDISGPSG